MQKIKITGQNKNGCFFLIFVVIGFVFLFSDVTIQAATEFTEEPILRLETGQHTAPVLGIAVDGKQRFLVSGSQDKTARVYDIKTGRLLQILRIPIEGTNDGIVLRYLLFR